MITINIVCVGNLKEKFSCDEQKEYVKRLSAFCKLNIIELKEQNQLSSPLLIVEKEGSEIAKNMKGYAVCCDIKGKQCSSEDFAKKLAEISMKNSVITFVVGGSYGIDEKVKKNANELISFSQMTFPHNLFRIMLLEQIYRAFTILAGKTYHK